MTMLNVFRNTFVYEMEFIDAKSKNASGFLKPQTMPTEVKKR